MRADAVLPLAVDLSCSLFVALPAVALTAVFVYKKEAEHNAHIDHEMSVPSLLLFPESRPLVLTCEPLRHGGDLDSEHNGGKAPKRVVYDYMNRRLKVRPLPWPSSFHIGGRRR